MFTPLTPLALVDTKFILLGAGIVGVAIVEKKLAQYGFISIAEIVFKTANILLPTVGIGVALYLIAKVSNIFL
jgi:hypothetical protein